MYTQLEKNLFIIFVFLATLTIYSCNKEASKDQQGSTTSTPTSNKTAGQSDNFIIRYVLEGKRPGIMEIIRSGKNQKESLEFTLGNVNGSTKIYILGDKVYTVSKSGNDTIGGMNTLTNYNDVRKFGETIVDNNEFVKYLESNKFLGTENILGLNCDIYEFEGGNKLFVHDKKYILKLENGFITAIATSFNRDTTFSKTEFDLPANVNFHDVNEKQIMSERMKDSLSKKNKKPQ